MGASDWLSALNWGTATGAETTSTVGTDRIDTREPPTQYHTGGLQITRMKSLLIAMSQYFAGGNRVRIRQNAANQFSANEAGLWLTTTLLKLYHGSGTAQTVAAGVMTVAGDVLAWTGSAWAVVSIIAGGGDGQTLLSNAASTGGVKWGHEEWSRVLITGSPTLTANSRTIQAVDVSGAVSAPILPVVNTCVGKLLVFKDELGNAAVNNITVTRQGGVNQIDGANTYVINTNRGAVAMYSDGNNNWQILWTKV